MESFEHFWEFKSSDHLILCFLFSIFDQLVAEPFEKTSGGLIKHWHDDFSTDNGLKNKPEDIEPASLSTNVN